MMPTFINRLTTIGALSVDQFMRQYWQRRPLCVRGAFAPEAMPIAPRQLFALARRDEVESRLIRQTQGRWQVRHGPFARLPSRRLPDWTLLVQGVDLHDDAAHAFLQQFRFIADARLDDLMISFATDGGGVGAHVDAYDVFLIQGHGRRRWRVAPPGDTTRVAGAPLKLLAHFQPTETWTLEPGDMLYLPPGWGHEGVALGDCMTLSVGFRAPSRHEFLGAFLSAISEQPEGTDPRFRDRSRTAPDHAAQLPDDLAAQLTHWAQTWRPTQQGIEQFVGCYLTEPKPTVWFEAPHPMPNPDAFAAHASQSGLRLARATRMLWRDQGVFINGEAVAAPAAARRWLQRLADQRGLSPAQCSQALRHPRLRALLHTWQQSGWLDWLIPPSDSVDGHD